MNISKMTGKYSLLLTLAFVCLASVTAFGQNEKLGIVSFKPPAGMTKTLKENVVAFSELNEATGKFCIITLCGATAGTGKPESDFKREWANLVLKNMKADADPKTQSSVENGWTATGGGSAVDSDAGKAFALLTVISGGGRTVSILSVFNDQAFLPKMATAPAPVDNPPASVPSGPTVGSMHAAALVGEFENNEIRANSQYAGKRMRIHGIVNIIEINRAGQVVLTFKSSISTSRMARCYFDKSQTARVGNLNANEEATVEGTVKGRETALRVQRLTSSC